MSNTNPENAPVTPPNPYGTQTIEGHRAAHVEGLQNELNYLEAQPKPNKARIAAVKKELDGYSKEPKSKQAIETATAAFAPSPEPTTETAADDPGPVPDQTPSTPEQQSRDTAKKAAPAKKAAASSGS